MKKQFPDEPDDYRRAREQLLEAEKALRAQMEAVAALRRRLPLGGRPNEDYVFRECAEGATRSVRLSELFEKQHRTLFLYSLMFAPDMTEPCPSCASFLDSLNASAPHLRQRLNLAVVARSSAPRVAAAAEQRGWENLRMLSAEGNDYARDFRSENSEGRQMPMAHVWVRSKEGIRHWWASELMWSGLDGGDPRHLDPLWPLWNVLDLTPEGRGDFDPQLRY